MHIIVFELTLMPPQPKLSEPIGDNTEEGDENLSDVNLMDQVTFDSREKCIEAVTKYYKDMNVFLKLYKGSDSRRIIFGCYHGGVYDNRLDLTDATRQRKTSSKLTDCPFKAKATYSKKTKLWTFKGETVPDHNHEITEHVAGYSAARRFLTEVEKAIVRDMAKAGVAAHKSRLT